MVLNVAVVETRVRVLMVTALLDRDERKAESECCTIPVAVIFSPYFSTMSLYDAPADVKPEACTLIGFCRKLGEQPRHYRRINPIAAVDNLEYCIGGIYFRL
jgi:hypothetical protein